MTLEIETELAVVGAGPAGSLAAWEAARRGVRVTLFNRDQLPGQRNACGGALNPDMRRYLDLPAEVIDLQIRTLRLVDGPEVTTIHGRRGPAVLCVRRAVLDRHLAGRAAAAGAVVLDAHLVQRVERGGTLLHGLRLQGRIPFRCRAAMTVLADGPRTLAWSCLGIGFDPRQRLHVATYMDLGVGREPPPPSFDLILDRGLLPQGYFWTIPGQGRINVGACQVFSPRRPVPLGQALARFVQGRPDLRRLPVLSRRSGLIPAQLARQVAAPGVLVAGDAAGLVNPLTGGGLEHALRSGRVAGEAAAEACRAGSLSATLAGRYQRRILRGPGGLWLGLLGALHQRQLSSGGDAAGGEGHGPLLRRYFLFHAAASRVLRRLP